MNQFKSLIILVVLFSFFQCSQAKTENTESNVASEVKATAPQESMLIKADVFEQKMKAENTVVLDVRTPGEVAQGIIKGATIIDFSSSDFRTKIENLDKETTYLVYCASGGRSHNTQELMNKMGFTKVYDLQGGIRAWNSAGKETVIPEN